MADKKALIQLFISSWVSALTQNHSAPTYALAPSECFNNKVTPWKRRNVQRGSCIAVQQALTAGITEQAIRDVPLYFLFRYDY